MRIDSMDSLDDWKKYETTLKETSKSEPVKGQVSYMTESQISAINFDQAVHAYARAYHLRTIPASNDALLQQDDTYYFIEFKSGNLIDKKKQAELKKKIYDSLLIFCDKLDATISFTRKHVSYVLVYEPDKNQKALVGIMNAVGALANRRADIFGLQGQFEGIYFKKVYALSRKVLENDFLPKYFGE